MELTADKYQQALQFYQDGRLTEALRLLKEALLEHETSERWNDWAILHLRCGNVREAERGFRRAVDQDSGNTVAAANLAILLERLGRPQEAAPSDQPAASKLPDRDAVAEFLDSVAQVPWIASDLPGYKKAALSRRAFDSSFYVRGCVELLRDLPKELRPAALAALAESADADHRRGLVVALYHIEEGDRAAALPFLRAVAERDTNDLYAEELLIETEAAISEAQGRPHPKFSGLREYLAESFCSMPWQHFELSSSDDVYLCCPGWQPVPAGDIGKNSAGEIWNSEMSQEIRRSILDGSFKYCSKINCPLIAGRQLPKRPAGDARSPWVSASDASANIHLSSEQLDAATASSVVRNAGPEKVVLTYDRTCNLACPSCRHDFFLANRAEQERQNLVLNGLLTETLQDARLLRMDGAGEMLVSQPSRRLLKEISRTRFPRLRFDLISNGQLFDRRAFEEFDLRGRIASLQISMDAATEATYRIVRRGGDFSRLLANLAFLDGLRQREGETFVFSLFFVVAAANFREMPAFVRLGERFHARVAFNLIRKWGHLSDEEFRPMNVASPRHRDHAEFLRALRAPELVEPFVDLGTVTQLRRELS